MRLKVKLDILCHRKEKMNVRIAFLGLWSLLKATHADVFDYECISDLPTCGTFCAAACAFNVWMYVSIMISVI